MMESRHEEGQPDKQGLYQRMYAVAYCEGSAQNSQVSLCCCALACRPNMATTSWAFCAQYYL